MDDEQRLPEALNESDSLPVVTTVNLPAGRLDGKDVTNLVVGGLGIQIIDVEVDI